MKVKELKELLANVDDELEIVGYENGMEQSGLMPVGKWGMKVISVKMAKKQWDKTADEYDAVLKEYMKAQNELKAKNDDLTNWTEKMVNKLRKHGEIITAPFDGIDKETDYETY